MKEREAKELLTELFERHNVPPISAIFLPKPIYTEREVTTEVGGKLYFMVKTYAIFNAIAMTDECWIEFFGLPSPSIVRHEFKHYLEYLGIKYIRKSPTKPKEAEGP